MDNRLTASKARLLSLEAEDKSTVAINISIAMQAILKNVEAIARAGAYSMSIVDWPLLDPKIYGSSLGRRLTAQEAHSVKRELLGLGYFLRSEHTVSNEGSSVDVLIVSWEKPI